MMILGILAMALCMGECVLDAMAYARHMDSGDQAGFALGMLFLISIGIPVTGALLAAGTLAEGKASRPPAARWAIVTVLLAGALFFLTYAALYCFVELRPFVGRGSWYYGTYLLTLLTFSVYLQGCALVVRSGPTVSHVSPASPMPPTTLASPATFASLASPVSPASPASRQGRPAWFTWILRGTAVVLVLQSLALLVGGGLGMVVLLAPNVVWLVVLLRSAGVAGRPATAPAASGG